ncbi:ParB/RepB/Spo0J family partition protein [Arenibacterium halophilum]|nr:ParB/RepB/Spo0J family partition protein [Arenibacterium halophilum]
MNTHVTPAAETRLIPLADLYLHDINPRQNGSVEDTAAMAASIAVNGLLQNLTGYADPSRGGIGIVAGGRRLRGLQHLAENGSGTIDAQPIDFTAIPVRVTDDAFVARAWAGTESATQKPLHPADEIRAYAAMADQGNSPEMIARAFAQSVAHVRRRLALADLIPEALSALREGHISLDVAKALTLAPSHAEQLATLTTARAGNWTAERVRRQLTPDSVASTDRRAIFVELEAYRAAGGTVIDDLFAECCYLTDADLLHQLFVATLDERAEVLRAEQGWAWVKVSYDPWSDHSLTSGCERIQRTAVELPTGDQNRLAELEDIQFSEGLDAAERAELEALRARAKGDYSDEDREAGGIVVLVDRHGTLSIEGAYRQQAKTRACDTAEGGSITPAAEKPLPQAPLDELHRIELLALQTALLDKPELVLDLLAWQIERRAPAWCSPFAVQLSDQQITPEAAQHVTIDARLAETSNATEFGKTDKPVDQFTAFQAKGKKHRNQVLTRHFVRTLNRMTSDQAPLADHLAELTGAAIRKVWTPCAPGYFKRLPAGRLDGLWQELTALPAEAEETVAFAKLKKSEKADELARLFQDASAREALGLSRDQATAIDAWLPAELQRDAK